jgi:DNA mismatch repair protein MutH
MKLNQERSYSDLDTVMSLLLASKGKTFRELDVTGRGDSLGNKGSLGNIIEESVLRYPINSDRQADILVGNERYELKVTPLIHRAASKTVAKERLVVDIIDYLNLPDEVFPESTFWAKARNIIIVYYYDDRTDRKHQPRLDCKIADVVFLKYTADDLSTIREDWQFIHDKVSSGHADSLSESDTSYLAACTKGKNAASSLRAAPAPAEGPPKNIMAKQRAFSYKQSYMTAVIQRILGQNKSMSRLPVGADETLNEYIQKRSRLYVGKTVRAIGDALKLPETTAKGANSTLVMRMLGSDKSKIGQLEQFTAAGVNQVKTVVLYDDNLPRESMSFPAITEKQWAQWGDASVEWHDSFIYDFFEHNKMLIMAFRATGSKRKDSDRLADTFVGGFLWNMPEEDIERYVYPVWKDVHDLLVKHESTHYGHKNGENRLPGQGYNHVFHIRPHGRNSRDKVALPNGEVIPKQGFWLDRTYVAKVVRCHMVSNPLS